MKAYKIVDDIYQTDNEFMPPLEVAAKLEEIYDAIEDGKSVVHQIKSLWQQYPHYPQILNILSVAYRAKGEMGKAYQTNKETFELFPNYIYAKINMMIECLNKNRLSELSTYGDIETGLTENFPNRKIFHYNEAIDFYKAKVLYYCRTNQASKIVGIAKQAEEEVLDDLAIIIFLEFVNEQLEVIDEWDDEELINDYLDHLDEELEMEEVTEDGEEIDMNFLDKMMISQHPKINFKEYDQSIQTEVAPQFELPSFIEPLYQFGLSIPTECIDELMAQDKVKIRSDLHKVIDDSVARFEFFNRDANFEDDSELSFYWHAVNLIRELPPTKETLEKIFYVLEQGEKLNFFYLAEIITEGFWQVLYPYCKDYMSAFETFCCRNEVYTYSKVPLIIALTKYANNHPAEKQKVQGVFAAILSNLLKSNENIDIEFASCMSDEVIDGDFIELSLLIKQLFDNGYIEPLRYNGFEDWKDAFEYTRINGPENNGETMDAKQLNKWLYKQFNH